MLPSCRRRSTGWTPAAPSPSWRTISPGRTACASAPDEEPAVHHRDRRAVRRRPDAAHPRVRPRAEWPAPVRAGCSTPSRQASPTGCAATVTAGCGPVPGDGVHCVHPDGTSAGQGADRRHGGQPDVRRAQPQPAVHLRVPPVDGAVHQRPRRAGPVTALALARIELTVGDLARGRALLCGRRWASSPGDRDARWMPRAAAALRGAHPWCEQAAAARCGGQVRGAASSSSPPGAPYPAGTRACDAVFQHFAMPVADMGGGDRAAAAVRPGADQPAAAPQQLPQRSGGAVAFKFRDPDGHPLELIQLARTGQWRRDRPFRHRRGGCRAQHRVLPHRSSGLRVTARQTNTGAEQDALDGLEGVSVDVVALAPAQANAASGAARLSHARRSARRTAAPVRHRGDPRGVHRDRADRACADARPGRACGRARTRGRRDVLTSSQLLRARGAAIQGHTRRFWPVPLLWITASLRSSWWGKGRSEARTIVAVRSRGVVTWQS